LTEADEFYQANNRSRGQSGTYMAHEGRIQISSPQYAGGENYEGDMHYFQPRTHGRNARIVRSLSPNNFIRDSQDTFDGQSQFGDRVKAMERANNFEFQKTTVVAPRVGSFQSGAAGNTMSLKSPSVSSAGESPEKIKKEYLWAANHTNAFRSPRDSIEHTRHGSRSLHQDHDSRFSEDSPEIQNRETTFERKRSQEEHQAASNQGPGALQERVNALAQHNTKEYYINSFEEDTMSGSTRFSSKKPSYRRDPRRDAVDVRGSSDSQFDNESKSTTGRMVSYGSMPRPGIGRAYGAVTERTGARTPHYYPRNRHSVQSSPVPADDDFMHLVSDGQDFSTEESNPGGFRDHQAADASRKDQQLQAALNEYQKTIKDLREL